MLRPTMRDIRNIFYIVVALSFLHFATSSTLSKGCRTIKFKRGKETNKILSNHVIENVTAENERSCMQLCFMSPRCVSMNTGPSSNSPKLLCQLNSADRYQHPQDFKDKPGFSYQGVVDNQCSASPCSEHGVCLHGYGDQYLCDCHPGWIGKNCSIDAVEAFGKIALLPAKTCRKLKQKRPSLPSGNYWIDPDEAGPSNAFLAYCDMETDGGGWTLVWAYKFRAYNLFNSKANAVVPTPKNYINSFGVISETAPQNETDFNALDFLKWQQIGSEIFMKSNINNWIACLPAIGSFVKRVAGSMECRMIKQIASQCSVIPDKFSYFSNGCRMSTVGVGMYYYYDTNTAEHWPTHDPCSRNEPNQLKNVLNPHGNIYVR